MEGAIGIGGVNELDQISGECGNHAEQALAGVAPGERCMCDRGFAGSSAASTETFFARHLGR